MYNIYHLRALVKKLKDGNLLKIIGKCWWFLCVCVCGCLCVKKGGDWYVCTCELIIVCLIILHLFCFCPGRVYSISIRSTIFMHVTTTNRCLFSSRLRRKIIHGIRNNFFLSTNKGKWHLLIFFIVKITFNIYLFYPSSTSFFSYSFYSFSLLHHFSHFFSPFH